MLPERTFGSLLEFSKSLMSFAPQISPFGRIGVDDGLVEICHHAAIHLFFG